MKLLRYGSRKHERPGLLDAKGDIRELSEHVRDMDGKTLGLDSL